MESLVFGLIVGALLMLPILLLLICYKILAPRNIFFTFGKENRIMYIMTGKKFTGKIILPSKTIYVDNQYDIKSFYSGSGRFGKSNFMGMYWIGWYPFFSLYERHQQWLEWKSNEKGDREIVVRNEMTPYLIAKPFEYGMKVEEAEDKKLVPLNILFTVIIIPVNALLPIFGNDDAYGQVQTLCRSQVLLYIREKTLSNLGGENANDTITHDDFSRVICALNEKIPSRPDGRGICEVLGYKILDAKIESVEISGAQKDTLQNASTAKYIAEQEASALMVKAEAEAKAAEYKAKGEKSILDVRSEYLQKISHIPGAMDVEKRKATPGVTTLVEKSSGENNILIGGK